MTIQETKQKLIDAGLVLAHQGHGDMTRGHVSVRVPGEPGLFFMKAHSIGLDEITMENILTINLDGEVVAGTARRHSEVYIHSEVYRARPDVHAVIHSHSTYSVALSSITRPLRPISQGGAAFADALPLYTDTIDLIRTPEMGRGVAAALGPHSAALLKSHGVVMTGRSLDEAVVLLTMLETAAQIQLLVEAAGGAAPEFPAEQIANLKRNLMEERQFPINFDYLVRCAKRR
jgi:ribulose-5-phosphate 4-epimerase/fuculose-1-phosphate aldolase